MTNFGKHPLSKALRNKLIVRLTSNLALSISFTTVYWTSIKIWLKSSFFLVRPKTFQSHKAGHPLKWNPKEFLRCLRNVDQSIHFRSERTVKTVDFNRRICSKESEDGLIGRKGHGYHFLEFARHHLYSLFGEGKDNRREVPHWLIGQAPQKN